MVLRYIQTFDIDSWGWPRNLERASVMWRLSEKNSSRKSSEIREELAGWVLRSGSSGPLSGWAAPGCERTNAYWTYPLRLTTSSLGSLTISASDLIRQMDTSYIICRDRWKHGGGCAEITFDFEIKHPLVASRLILGICLDISAILRTRSDWRNGASANNNK